MRQIDLINSAYVPRPEDCLFPVWRNADNRLVYPCPDELWTAHFTEWRKRRQRGETGIVEPFSAGHCMFEDPRAYGIIPWDCTDVRKIRRMYRRNTIAVLDGWDREMRQSKAGMRQLARIVRATVAAKMAGQETGGTPFVACVLAGL